MSAPRLEGLRAIVMADICSEYIPASWHFSIESWGLSRSVFIPLVLYVRHLRRTASPQNSAPSCDRPWAASYCPVFLGAKGCVWDSLEGTDNSQRAMLLMLQKALFGMSIALTPKFTTLTASYDLDHQLNANTIPETPTT